MNSGLNSRGVRVAFALGAMLLAASGVAATNDASLTGVVFVESNESTGNSLLMFAQNADGTLTYQESIPTGGTGNGGSLGQGALAYNPWNGQLYAVNAGSDSISAFSVGARLPRLLQTISSSGTAPISVTTLGDLVYVLNAGGASNLAGFIWNPLSGLRPIAGSVKGLSQAAPGAKQVGISPSGSVVVVTEENTNMIDLFPVKWEGRLGPRTTVASAGSSPFGFAFGFLNTLVVSNAAGGIADASSTSSYLYAADSLSVQSAKVPTNQTAGCWITLTSNSRLAYVADAGSNAITGYKLSPTGSLSRMGGPGPIATTDPHPIDMMTSRDDRYLYVVASGAGAIDEYEIEGDGSLKSIGSVGGLPTSVSGIAGF